jgi:hypothetical protein
VQEVDNLPTIGTWALPVPADGREAITFMLRASDGLHEVAAQTTVQVRCPESWFFTPAPPGCPTPPLITTFREQQFERGTIVYAPALGVHYVMVAGQSALRVADSFVPGMPLSDPGVEQPSPRILQAGGPIDYAGAVTTPCTPFSTDQRRNSLSGMLQRMVSAAGEAVYFRPVRAGLPLRPGKRGDYHAAVDLQAGLLSAVRRGEGETRRGQRLRRDLPTPGPLQPS